jgi:hypothetical protein
MSRCHASYKQESRDVEGIAAAVLKLFNVHDARFTTVSSRRGSLFPAEIFKFKLSQYIMLIVLSRFNRTQSQTTNRDESSMETDHHIIQPLSQNIKMINGRDSYVCVCYFSTLTVSNYIMSTGSTTDKE